jgi:putative SOS response-associated peptidase YedK
VCGRFFLRPDVAEILAFFEAGPDDALGLALPQWNVAPTQPVLAAYRDELGQRKVGVFRWGLVPSWWKDAKLPVLLNARCEEAATKPAFRAAFKSRRCLVPISGFYEWRKDGKARVPFAVTRPDGGLLALAGLWETWWKGGEPLRSLTILTCAPSADVAPIHDRMPCVLPAQAWPAWLDPRTPVDVASGLLGPDAGGLVTREVGTGVNDARHTDGGWLPADLPGTISPP